MAQKTLESESKLGIMTPGQKGEDEEVKKPAKAAKITNKDWAKVEDHLKQELENRKKNDFRQSHEKIWKEVDRQIAMNAMQKFNNDGSEVDMGWHNVIELGELSKASENISADVRRIIFPQTRFWFDAHCDITPEMPLGDDGSPKEDQKLQEQVDGRVRAFMMQQHADFGLKDRVELSIKEALHHGSFVAEVDEDSQEFIYDAVKTKMRKSPVWIPHSMWNCYPDPSPSVIGTNMFYDGNMYIESYVPRYKAERMVKDSKEDGWMPSQWKKVGKDEHEVKGERIKDVKITTYWGDINIERADGDLYYPNHKVILMNGKIVYMAPIKTPYKNLIYRGYERNDVRDPYYMSPIIKMSPMQKLATLLTNKTMDGVELSIEPPIVYDGNDPDFVLNGGPLIYPGSKTSTKGQNSFSQVKIGDLGPAVEMLQFCMNEMKEKLGRPGKPVGDRATKAEVQKSERDQEASLIDFIDKMEIGLRSYLYMQHEMNLHGLETYTYYSPEMHDPDFLKVKKEDLPKDIHFEVVGARGILGEEERSQKMSVVTAFALGNPITAPLVAAKDVLVQMYQDAGVKNAERFINNEQLNPAQLMAQLQQAKEMLQKMGAELQKEKTHSATKMAKIQSDHQTREHKLAVDHQDRMTELRAEMEMRRQELIAKITESIKALKAEMMTDLIKESANHHREMMKVVSDHALQREQNQIVMDTSGASVKDTSKHMGELAKHIQHLAKSQTDILEHLKKPRKVRTKRTKDGLEAEIS